MDNNLKTPWKSHVDSDDGSPEITPYRSYFKRTASVGSDTSTIPDTGSPHKFVWPKFDYSPGPHVPSYVAKDTSDIDSPSSMHWHPTAVRSPSMSDLPQHFSPGQNTYGSSPTYEPGEPDFLKKNKVPDFADKSPYTNFIIKYLHGSPPTTAEKEPLPAFPFTHRHILSLFPKQFVHYNVYVGLVHDLEDDFETLAHQVYNSQERLSAPSDFFYDVLQNYQSDVLGYFHHIGIADMPTVKLIYLLEQYYQKIETYLQTLQSPMTLSFKDKIVTPARPKVHVQRVENLTEQRLRPDTLRPNTRYNIPILQKHRFHYMCWDHKDNIHGTCVYHALAAAYNVSVENIACMFFALENDNEFYSAVTGKGMRRINFFDYLKNNSTTVPGVTTVACQPLTRSNPNLGLIVFCVRRNPQTQEVYSCMPPIMCFYNHRDRGHITQIAFLLAVQGEHTMIVSVAPPDQSHYLDYVTYDPSTVYRWFEHEINWSSNCTGMFMSMKPNVTSGVR